MKKYQSPLTLFKIKCMHNLMSLKVKLTSLTLLCQMFINGVGLFKKNFLPTDYANVLGRFAYWICSPKPETRITSFPFTDMISLTGFTNSQRLKKFAEDHNEYLQKAAHPFLKAMEKLETSGLKESCSQSAKRHAANIRHFLEILNLKIDEYEYDNYQKAYAFLNTKEFFRVLRKVMKEDKVHMPSKEFIADLRKFHIQNMYLFVAKIMNAQAIKKLQSLVEADPECCRLIAQIIMQAAAGHPYGAVDAERVKHVKTLLDLVKVQYTDKIAEAISCMTMEDVVEILAKSKIRGLPPEFTTKLSEMEMEVKDLMLLNQSSAKNEADL